MTERTNRPIRPLLAVSIISLLLAACNGPDQEPEPDQIAEPPPEIHESSILRPDIVEVPVEEVPLQPLDVTIGFPDGGAELSEEAVARLGEVLASEQLGEGWPIVLRGHSDSVGNDADNLAASGKRAEAVAAWLEEHGVAEDRITVIALGEQRPIAPNAHLDGTPDLKGRAANRRVDIEIAPLAEPAPDADQGEPASDTGDSGNDEDA